MAVTKETCVDKGFCIIHKTGHCTLAVALDGQTAYFDSPKLASHFEETGEEGFEGIVADHADKKLHLCQRPNLLKAAARRARARALKFFHPR